MSRVSRPGRREHGVVAVFVAILAVVLMAFGALTVDLGNAYARARTSQTSADLSALAGAAQLGGAGGVMRARVAAIDYIREKNQVQSDDGVDIPACAVVSATSPVCWDNDGALDNGEIEFSRGDGVKTVGVDATRIRVVAPRRTVEFGLAKAIGFSRTSVTKAATAQIFSPGAATAPPFYLTASDNGLTCIKDDSPGVKANSSSRAVVIPLMPATLAPSLTAFSAPNPPQGPQNTATAFTITGNDLDNVTQVIFTRNGGGAASSVSVTVAPNNKSVTGTTPLVQAGVYTVTADGGATGSLTFTFTAPTAAPTLTTVNPTSGPELAQTPFTLSGSGFQGSVRVTFNGVDAVLSGTQTATSLSGTTPALTAGPATVRAFNGATPSSNTLAYTFTPSPAPVITINPTQGPETASNTLVVSGTNLPSAVTSASVQFGGTDAQQVTRNADGTLTVRPPVGMAGTTVQVVVFNGSTASNAVPYTYTTDPTTCAGTSSNRGFIDEPRFSGNAQSLEKNIKLGIDHTLHTYQTYKLPVDSGSERPAPVTGDCDALPSTEIYKSGSVTPLADINCLRLSTGNTSGSLEKGFFDNPGGRLYQLDAGATTGTIGGHSGVDNDTLFDPEFIAATDRAAFEAAILAGASPTAAQRGWLKEAVVNCPRFAILPVTTAPNDPPNGTSYFPIIGFKGVFFGSTPADTASDNGFRFEGSSLRIVKAYVFDLGWLDDNISSAAVGPTQNFIGTGPKIARLVE